MDLHWIPGADASAAERSAVDGVLGPPTSGWEPAPRHLIQSTFGATEVPGRVDLPGATVSYGADIS